MNLLEMRGITKRFHGVTALDDITLAVRPGEIHAVVGENGAGKSTLMKVLSGVYPHGDYEGAIHFEGRECRFDGTRCSEQAGIVIIHQERALVPQLSLAENIFLGNEPSRGGVIDTFAAYAQARALLRQVGVEERPSTRVSGLGLGKQQLVEIAKALSRDVKLLILDEPTACLNDVDSDALLALLVGLKARAIACILISHKLHEIARVADRVTVIRDGCTVRTFDCADETISEDRVIQAMVGRPMADRYPKRSPTIGARMLEIRNWRVYHPEHAERLVIKGVDLHAARGEIVGIAGLMGAGRTELALSVFGRSYGRRISGEVRLNGRVVDVSTVEKATAAGLAYVTEDRMGNGLVLEDSVSHNVVLANLRGVSSALVIDTGRELQVANDYRQRLRIHCAGVNQRVVDLSGGNQQKVLLARSLFADPEVLLLDEPTRGIDVGAKFEIHALMAELAAAGKCVVMISSEIPELLGMCDRIYVMNEGSFVGEFDRREASREKIMHGLVTERAA